MENSFPLVSVVIVTFNSEQFIEEALDSVSRVSYKKIELIISDDCSNDNTVKYCKEWSLAQQSRFERIAIIESNKNTGVSGNCNRGLNVARGEWVKFLAGDDALLPRSIESYLNFAERSNAECIHSNALFYKDEFKDSCLLGYSNLRDHLIADPDVSVKKQYEFFLRENVIRAPTVFFKTSTLKKMGGFDERIPMIEDWPMWLKLTRNGIPLKYMEEITAKYRVHSQSISNMKESEKSMYSGFKGGKLEPIYLHYIYDNVGLVERLLYQYNFLRIRFFKRFGFDENTKLNRFLEQVSAYPALKFRSIKINKLMKGYEKPSLELKKHQTL